MMFLTLLLLFVCLVNLMATFHLINLLDDDIDEE